MLINKFFKFQIFLIFFIMIIDLLKSFLINEIGLIDILFF